MTTSAKWLSAVSGNFNSAGDWSPIGVPGATTDVALNAAGSAYTVTSSTSETILSLLLASNATLDVRAGVFTTTSAGAPTRSFTGVENNGLIKIETGAAFVVGTSNSPSYFGSALQNDGTVVIASGGSLSFRAPYNQLKLGGSITMAGTASLVGGSSAGYLENIDNIISGSGTIGSAHLQLGNDQAGVVDANVAGKVLNLVEGANTISNAGLIEATSGGTLNILGNGNSQATPAMYQDESCCRPESIAI